jgi:hypothetical protein
MSHSYVDKVREAMNAPSPERMKFDHGHHRDVILHKAGHFCVQFSYLKVIKSVRLRVEAPSFNGSFVAFELC